VKLIEAPMVTFGTPRRRAGFLLASKSEPGLDELRSVVDRVLPTSKPPFSISPSKIGIWKSWLEVAPGQLTVRSRAVELLISLEKFMKLPWIASRQLFVKG
jgi:hypothetical protein